MKKINTRWKHIAALSGTLQPAPSPEPPRHLASRLIVHLNTDRRAIIPWPLAAAIAASLYVMMVPALPLARAALTPSPNGIRPTNSWLSGLPHLPGLPLLQSSVQPT